MKVTLLVFALVLIFYHDPVLGIVSTGGNFSLDRSLSKASHFVSTGNALYQLEGSFGEGFSPITNQNQALKAYPYRLFEGFLGIPQKIDPSQSYSLNLVGANQITIPGGVISQPYEPMWETNPTVNPVVSDPTTISEATQKLNSEFGSTVDTPLSAIEMRILLEDNTLQSNPLNQALNVSLTIEDLGNGGNIIITRLDESTREWVPFQTHDVNEQADLRPSMTQRTCLFSHSTSGLFAIFQTGPINVGRTYAFPVPWRPHSGNPSLYGTQADGITFTNLPSTGVIEIYNIAGERVREIVIPAGTSQFQWDVKTGSGNDVASGIYIWSIESNGQHNTGKIMIIR